jgi:hypothetical protein
MLGDDGGQPRQFGDLMPGRLGVAGAGFDRQRRVTVGTDRGNVADDRVDPIGRQADPVMPSMPGLSSGSSSGGRLGGRLGSVERIGRGRRGTIGRIALKLDGEFFDLSLENGDLSQGHVEFTTQLDAFGTASDRSQFERDHRV